MRIGTAGQNEALVTQMLRKQAELFETQRQVQTGKKYDDVEGFGAGTASLVSSKSLMSRLNGFYDTNKLVSGRLEAFDTALGELDNIGARLRDAMQNARAIGDGTGFIPEVRSLFEQTVSVLNTRFEGRFLFGGTNSDQPPMAVETADQLIATAEPPVGDYFNGDPAALTARLDERTSVALGTTATVGQDLINAMQRLLQFDDGTVPNGVTIAAGSLDGKLSDEQRDFVGQEVDRVLAALDGIRTAAAENGLNIRVVGDVQARLEDQKITLTELIASREDADLAETATKLNQQQVALEASMRVIGKLKELSLVNLI
ncbi:MAG: hypothetical protein VYB54_09115 [Pseudomonadota bacterium]|nr:hypothetical protein [Pseudomonadota bacterium]